MATTKLSPEPQRRFIDQRELSAMTGRSMRTLEKDRFFKRDIFPYYKVGRHIKYDAKECEAIILRTRTANAGGEAA